MRVWSAIQQCRAQDRAIEDQAGIRHRDPQADKVNDRVYTRSDIRALENERLSGFWRRRRRG